jgi:hypothetical protein
MTITANAAMVSTDETINFSRKVMLFRRQPVPSYNFITQWFKNSYQYINASGFVQAYFAMRTCRRSTGIQVLRELPRYRLAFDRTVFADDPRIRAMSWDR